MAVSGGADSTALLLLLLELREELGISLSVLHFNHQLRGRASNADEKFVAGLAEKHGLTLHVAHSDIRSEARRGKRNLEDAGRRARYAWFARLVSEGRVSKIATAHTLDDQAETVLAHILRGTGLAGLAGIHPVAGNVIRPLLAFRRPELRKYLRARRQSWREDASNQDTTRLRARIRKKLLPLLEEQFQSGAAAHLASLADFAREDNLLLESLAARRCRTLAVKEPGGTRIRVEKLLRPLGEKRWLALTTRMLRRLAKSAKRGTGQVTAQHIETLMELAERGESGKSVDLPGGLAVHRTRDELVFVGQPPPGGRHSNQPQTGFEQIIHLSATLPAAGVHLVVPIPQLYCAIRLTAIDWPDGRRETNRDTGAVLDRARLREPLVLRNWRSGDRFQPAGRDAPRSLKRLLSDRHISRWERAAWPVLTSGGVVAWVRGFPAAVEFAADSGTHDAIAIREETAGA